MNHSHTNNLTAELADLTNGTTIHSHPVITTIPSSQITGPTLSAPGSLHKHTNAIDALVAFAKIHGFVPVGPKP